ncbi:MAG TPA: MaoC/PaaZ C-terminal domain-containing protein [Stellaceae bacterium]|nr:MaoC/PaaZ C-terminal domain-containing protein [Stellaceae bacterium]
MDTTPSDVLASHTFRAEDQERFARLSGDRNPLHMDPIAARRTQAGAPVVHGMHLLLWSLEALARRNDRATPPPQALEARFLKPVYAGDTPSVRLSRPDAAGWSLHIEIAGVTLATVRLTFAERSSAPAPLDIDREPPEHLRMPRELRLEEMAGRAGGIPFAASAAAVAEPFPAAAAWIGAGRLRGLAALSYLVGMECPGLHSLFSSLTVDLAPMDRQEMIYAVTEIDDRFRLVRLRIAGAGLAGIVEAFARRPPVRQLSIEAAATHVSRGEFAGQHPLIIGGSRGLGELTAKMIAAGGGHPVITYARGAADAEAVRQEIAGFGGGCAIMPYDATQPAAAQLERLPTHPTELYYFATSQIFRRKLTLFDADLLRDFMAIYVSGFYDLCAALAARFGSKLSAFYPSSIAVERRPRDMTEYAMAKSAGEALAADMTRFMPGVRVTVTRLPRLPSDQTATVAPAESSSALEVLLPIIRAVQKRAQG